MTDRIDGYLANMGYPELAAGFGTLVIGDTATEITNSYPLRDNLHEAIGYGSATLAALAVMGAVAEVRRIRLQSESPEDIDSSGSN